MNVIYLALAFLALLGILALIFNRKPARKRRTRTVAKPEFDSAAAMEEMKPYLKRLQEAKTSDEKLMALMDLQGNFGKKYPELVEIWSRRGRETLTKN